MKAYKYDENLELQQVSYTNMNDMSGLLNFTEYSPHFKQEIYNVTSGVQIPIELYEGCKL